MMNKNIKHKLMIVVFYMLFLCTQTINAYELDTDIYIDLETYNIESSCSYGYKTYKFTISNKDNIFKNYKNVNSETIVLSNELYTIKPSSAYAKNKSTIIFTVSEYNLKRIFKSDTVRIDYSSNIFDYDMLHKEYSKYHPEFVMSWDLFAKANTNLSIRKNDLKYYIDECKQAYNSYSKKQKARNLKKSKAKDKKLKQKKEAARIKADKKDLVWLH